MVDDKEKLRAYARSHPNFMTPHIISVRKLNDKEFVEISEGTGIENEKIFGVSIAKKKGDSYEFLSDKRSQMFYNLKDAQKHADSLRTRKKMRSVS